jgi:NADH dehydrogenase
MSAPHRVVIIGSGFGGLFAAKNLRKAPVEVTIIARTSHHLFQPLLYQVATGVLSEGEIAPSTREILRRQKNATVLLGDVTHIDLAAKTVTSTSPLGTTVTPYDSLIVAAGAGQSYFGNDQFADYAPGMKSIDDALELRGRIFGVFELAELAKDRALQEKLLTFVVVGAGPTGVEMAGQIAELSRRTLQRDFRNIDPSQARIVLVDAAPAVLGTFGDKLSKAARERLEEMGVEVQLDLKVVDVDAEGVTVEDKAGNRRRIDSYCKVWAAGVAASPLGRQLAEQSGDDLDREGRVKLQPDLTLPGHPEVFVVGDMATVSRFSAVAAIGPLRLKGFVAWLIWLVIHLVYLIGFKNRVTALLHWTVSFIGRGRSERTATLQQVLGRRALEKMRETDSSHWAGLGPLAASGDGASRERESVRE